MSRWIGALVIALVLVSMGILLHQIRDRGDCLRWDQARMHNYFIGSVKVNSEMTIDCLEWERP